MERRALDALPGDTLLRVADELAWTPGLVQFAGVCSGLYRVVNRGRPAVWPVGCWRYACLPVRPDGDGWCRDHGWSGGRPTHPVERLRERVITRQVARAVARSVARATDAGDLEVCVHDPERAFRIARRLRGVWAVRVSGRVRRPTSIAALRGMRLDTLDLDDMELDAEDVIATLATTEISTLVMCACVAEAPDDFVDRLARALPRLTELTLMGTSLPRQPRVTAWAGLTRLGLQFADVRFTERFDLPPAIEELDVSGNEWATGAVLGPSATLRTLKMADMTMVRHDARICESPFAQLESLHVGSALSALPVAAVRALLPPGCRCRSLTLDHSVVYMCNDPPPLPPTLRSLSLIGCYLDDMDVEPLSAALSRMPELRTLRLSGNGILGTFPTLPPALLELDVAECATVCRSAELPTGLTRLNAWGSTSIPLELMGLQRLTQLRSLFLTGCRLGERYPTAVALIEALPHMVALSFLAVASNQLHRAGLAYGVVRALPPRVCGLDLGDNGLTDVLFGDLEPLLVGRQWPLCVTIINNPLTPRPVVGCELVH